MDSVINSVYLPPQWPRYFCVLDSLDSACERTGSSCNFTKTLLSFLVPVSKHSGDFFFFFWKRGEDKSPKMGEVTLYCIKVCWFLRY